MGQELNRLAQPRQLMRKPASTRSPSVDAALASAASCRPNATRACRTASSPCWVATNACQTATSAATVPQRVAVTLARCEWGVRSPGTTTILQSQGALSGASSLQGLRSICLDRSGTGTSGLNEQRETQAIGRFHVDERRRAAPHPMNVQRYERP